ncbi:putative transcription repressor ofp9 [Quercus suber]|uniref:Transcription repressor n=1 Tax=Quercus suber TaxID=58331 RepID=A0AAW0LZL1_QUESU
MIRERQEARQGERRRQSSEGTKFIVMVALENCSYDPREDFRESMVEMIMTNRIQDPKDLRSLLNYYVSMNTDEYHGTILEVFHEASLSSKLPLGEEDHVIRSVFWVEKEMGVAFNSIRS